MTSKLKSGLMISGAVILGGLAGTLRHYGHNPHDSRTYIPHKTDFIANGHRIIANKEELEHNDALRWHYLRNSRDNYDPFWSIELALVCGALVVGGKGIYGLLKK